MSEQTLVIENLPGNLDDVRLKLDFHFRNKKKSGGEVFKILEHPYDKRKALLVYLDNSGVKNVLERVHQVEFGDLGMVELIVKLHGDEKAQAKKVKPITAPRRKSKPVQTTVNQEPNTDLFESRIPNIDVTVYAEEDIAVRSMEEVEFIESCMNLSEFPEIKNHGGTIVACGTESSPYLKVTAAKEYIKEVVNVVKQQLSFILVEKHAYSRAGESKVLKKNEANAKAKAKELHCSLHLSTEQPRKCDPTKSFTHKINSCITVTVAEGDLHQHTADALICPMTSNLLFDNLTARQFLKAGGFQIKEVCRKLQNEKQSLFAGNVIISEPGNLLAKTLIYAVLPKSDQSLSSYYLQLAILCSLQKAEERNSESVAMPVLGCETCGFSVEESYRAIMEAIQQFCTNHQNTPKILKNIFVVDSDVKIVEEFNTFITQLVFPKVSRSSYPASPTSPLPPSKPILKSDTSVIKGVKIEVKKGDITRETVQAIVNTTNSSMDFKKGVSGAIFKAAGSYVKKECKNIGPLQSETVAVTGAGSLQCDFIIHMMGPQSAADVRLRVKKVLERCEEKKISTISFPALGTGLGGVKGAEAIQAMLQGFEDHFSHRSLTDVKLIYIVINQNNVFEEFQQGLKEWLKNNQVTEDIDNSVFDEESDAYRNEDACDTTTQTVINQKQLTSKKRKLKKTDIGVPNNFRHTDHVGWDPIRGYAVDIQDPVLRQLFDMCGITDEQLEDKKTSKVIHKFIQKQGGVEAVKSQFLREVFTPKQPLTLETEISPASFPVTTIEVYGTSSAELAMLKKYLDDCISDECISREIESSHLANLSDVIIDISQNTEVHILMSSLDKLTMSGEKDDVLNAALSIYSFIQEANKEEIQEIEEKRKRDIYDKEQIVASLFDLLADTDTAIIQTPPAWSKMDERDTEIILLSPDSEEYRNVRLEFLNSSQQPKVCHFQVLQIHRIQNKALWQRYAVLKQEVNKKYPKQTNEQFLYHGTTNDICQKINKNGFNRSFCGRNATLHGKGTYFAKDARYSCRDQYSNPDDKGLKYVYRARVMTGLPCKSRRGMKEPDRLNPNDPQSGLYDCAVDDLQNPSIFVVFCDAGAYPDYLITFKTV